MNGTIHTRLSELGLQLPAASAPAANYVSHVRSGNLLYVSGQISLAGNDQGVRGRLGAEVSVEDGVRGARIAALALLAQIDAAIEGNLAHLRRVIRIGVFVASTPQFEAHSQIGNGVSDLIVAVLGDSGRHVRTSVGVASLPAGAAVEVDALIELQP